MKICQYTRKGLKYMFKKKSLDDKFGYSKIQKPFK